MVFNAFKNWLIGKEKPKDPKEIRVNLKVQKRRLNRLEKKMKKEKKKAVKKVRKAVKKDNRELAMEYAKNAVIYTKDLSHLAKFRAKIVQMLHLIQRSRLTSSLSDSIQDLAASLGEIQKEIANPEVKKSLTKIASKSEKVKVKAETMQEMLDMASINRGVETAAKKLVEGIAIEEGVKEAPVEEEEVSEEVEELLQEVKKEF